MVLGPVVHGGERDWLLKLPMRSLKELGCRSAAPTFQPEGTDSETPLSPIVRVIHALFGLIGRGGGELQPTAVAASMRAHTQTAVARTTPLHGPRNRPPGPGVPVNRGARTIGSCY